tara:strand:- start:529 stop:1275 length:747 start_codon:yes stop_codon:yes gene_type:complete
MSLFPNPVDAFNRRPSLESALGSVGATIGAKFGPVGSALGELFGSRLGDDLSRSSPDTPPASGPAGVDSPATVTRVSQTSQTTPLTGPMGYGGMPSINRMGNGMFQQANVVSLFRNPAVTGAVGAVGGAIAEFFFDEFGREKKLVITRKLQRDIKKLFMLSGGSFEMTAELYEMATGRRLTPEQVVKIYTKTFKNQGPYVTKAAVRKTRSTIRKMETLCDLKDRLCPPKRRTPVRRRAMSSQTITQVK